MNLVAEKLENHSLGARKMPGVCGMSSAPIEQVRKLSPGEVNRSTSVTHSEHDRPQDRRLRANPLLQHRDG